MATFPLKRQHFPLIAAMAIPPLIYLAFRAFPEVDVPIWRLVWYTRLFQFYAGSFAGLVALVAAVFTSSATSNQASPRTLFITIAFVNISTFVLISSIATPDILIDGYINPAFLWSLRLAFPTSALFFTLANIRWQPATAHSIVAKRHLIWAIGFITLAVYATLVFAFPTLFDAIEDYNTPVKNVLATLAIGMMLFAAFRTWYREWPDDSHIRGRLSVVLILFAEAQFFLAFGEYGRFSWLLYHPVTLTAVTIAVSAILTNYMREEDFQIDRFFAAVGIIAIGGLSLIIGEFGTRWLRISMTRTTVVSLMLIQGALSFGIMFVVVVYLNRMIQERTRALRREQELRADLTRLIVHDLKNPLSVVTSGINLLLGKKLGNLGATQMRLLNSLDQSVNHILNMINDLLDVERLEAGSMQLKKTPLKLTNLLQESVEEHRIIASTQKQTVTLVFQPGLPPISGDQRLFQRVFANLLSNAVKFTPQEGRIEVTAVTDENHLIIKIADDGPGVPMLDRERIFNKFAQVKGAERRGAGLGLTFCRMVVEAHDGVLSVEDSVLGGALFKLTLPLPSKHSLFSESPQNALPDSDWELKTF